jgi:PAS domain S-box-containing protein
MPSAPIQVWVVAAPDRLAALSTRLASMAPEAAALARAGALEVHGAHGLPASLPEAADPADQLVVVDLGGAGGFDGEAVLAWLRQHAADWPILLLSEDDTDTGALSGLAPAFDAGAIDLIPHGVLDARVLARIARWTAATGRLRREERRARAQLQGYLETKSIGVVTIDRAGTILFANASLEQMFGYGPGELSGQKIEVLVPPAVRGRHEGLRAGYWSHPGARPASQRLEITGWRKDGTELAIEAALSHVRVGGEEWVTALVSDVSERRAIERALSSSEAKLRAIVESGTQAIALMDPAGTVLAINRNMRETVERLFGGRVDPGDPLPALLPPANRAAVEAGLAAAAQGETRTVERELTSWRGEPHWFEITYAPAAGPAGSVSMVSMTVLSIDERKRASLQLERSEERLSAILRFSWDIIAIVDRDGRVRSASPSVERVLGRAGSELAGIALLDLVHPDDREVLSSLASPGTGGRWLEAPVEARFAHADGWWVPLEVVASDQRAADAAGGVIVNLRDVSQRRAAEEALRRSEQKLSASVRNSMLAFIEWDREGRVAGWNPAAEQIFGWRREEALGQHAFLIVPEPARAAVAQLLEDLGRGAGGTHSVNQNVTRDGRIITCEWYNSPLLDDDGEVVAVVSLAHDITQKLREQDELRRAKELAEAATRAKSEFLANMSHEIRTPMNAVIGMTTLLLDSSLDPDQRDAAETIRRSSESLLTIINEILDFSKIESGRLELENLPFDPRRVLFETLGMVRPEAERRGLALDLTVDAGLPRAVLGDQTRLSQVLLNLVGNALKFTERGAIRVHVSAVEGADQPLLHVAVQDTGIGIPPERRDRLFCSFSQVDASTTRRFGGTGLGLAISKRLVELMGGVIWVESEVGAGSTFHFTFAAPPTALPVAPPAAPGEAWFDRSLADRVPLTILLVEDHPVNQRVALRMLERLGYQADLAADGRDAVEAASRRDYDVILMDVQMPRMDGLEAARRIRRLPPPVRQPQIIAMTANVMAGDREACLAAGMDGYVGKPVRVEELVAALQRAGAATLV